MSVSVLPPSFLCVSTSDCPPENAYLFIFFLISFFVSVKKIEDVESEADILVAEPWRAGKNTLNK